MDQRFWETSCRYSIRKLTVGTASVLLGAFFLSLHQVDADSIVGSQNESNHLEAAPSIESPTDRTGGSKSENPHIAPISEERSSTPDRAVESHHTDDSTTSIETNKDTETMKVETPVAKQTDYQLSYNQPAAATYDGWEKQALPVGNGEMGAKVFGLIGEERIQYNEKTLWSGGPQPDSTDYNGGNYQDRHKVLAEIRKALEEGNRQKAKQLAEEHLVGPNNAQYGRYLSFGDIFMVFNNQKKGLENVTDYHRG